MSLDEVHARKIVEKAAGLAAAAQREEYVNAACAGDSALRLRVQELLTEERTGDSIAWSVSQEGQATVDLMTPMREGPGSTIGRYRLLQQIGEGGFGVVFMAEQQTPVRRRVALKIIKLGMDTKQVIARFEAERQALAMMDHPNIARVLDAGATEAGRPYFVMELVRGTPLTEYCDKHQLDPRQRIELFILVCQAVQHAHQKGIIHRDLKPQNILVTIADDKPVPKVIDFGIAKATQARLTERTYFTEFRQLIGTPQYMSPEQAEADGVDVDTRTDVYSLGVLLYELLVGTTPIDATALRGMAYAQMQKLISEIEPSKPSTRLSTMGRELAAIALHRRIEPARLGQMLRRELDWIVMRALEKDRSRRYETASNLAADLTRYLRNETVEACPPSALYLFRKGARRHRALLGAAAVVLLGLSLGVVGSTLGMLRAKKAQAAQAVLRVDAENARQDAIQKYWDSSLALARASRFSHKVGQRFDGMLALSSAAQIHFAPELRDEAIASSALIDARLERRWPASTESHLNYMAFDGAARRYARPDAQGAITIRRVSDEKELAHFNGPGKPIERLFRFSDNGRYLVSRHGVPNSQTATIAIWDVENQRPAWAGSDALSATSADFAPDDRSIVVLENDGAVSDYELPDGKLLRHMPAVTGMASSERHIRVSRDGLRAAATADHRLCIYDLRTGAVVKNTPLSIQSAGLAWHPDGIHIAVAAMDAGVFVLDVSVPGVPSNYFIGREHLSRVIRVEISRSGDLLATTSWDGTVRLWNPLVKGNSMLTLEGVETADVVRFCADDTRLASGTSLYTLAPPREYRVLAGHQDGKAGPRFVDSSPDGRLLASASSDGVRLWDAESAREILHLPIGHHDGYSVLFHPDGKSLFTCGNGQLLRWTLEWKDRKLTVGPPVAAGPSARYAALSADGALMAISPNGLDDVIVQNVGDAFDHYRVIGQHKGFSYIAISPDGRWVATNTRAGEVKVWDVRGINPTVDLPGIDTSAILSFTPDGKYLVAGSRSRYQFWSAPSWKPAHRITRDSATVVGLMSFTADGSLMAIARSNFTVSLADPASGSIVANLIAPDSFYLAWLHFSRDGRRLFAATENHAIQVWDLSQVLENLARMKLASGLPSIPPPVKLAGSAIQATTRGMDAMVSQLLAGDLSGRKIDPAANTGASSAGTLLLRAGQTKQAIDELKAAIAAKDDNIYNWRRLNAAYLYCGDDENVRQSAHQLLSRFGQTPSPPLATSIASRLTVIPCSPEDAQAAYRLADQALQATAAGTFPPGQSADFFGAMQDNSIRQTTAAMVAKGIAAYRLGNFSEALDLMIKASEMSSDPMFVARAASFQAMALARLGRHAQATTAFQTAIDRAPPSGLTPGSFDWGEFVIPWIVLDHAIKEARSVISDLPVENETTQ